jgi:hypothetical protein
VSFGAPADARFSSDRHRSIAAGEALHEGIVGGLRLIARVGTRFQEVIGLGLQIVARRERRAERREGDEGHEKNPSGHDPSYRNPGPIP